MSLPYEEMNDPISKRIQDACKGGMAPPEIKIRGCVLPKNYLNFAESIRDFEVKPDDIWVIAFPKCGTTWTQEMVWLLGNNLDFDAAKSQNLLDRYTFLEVSGLFVENSIETKMFPDSVDIANNAKSPRFIKTHLPPSLLPKKLFEVKPKIIYVHRNPKDAAVSYYHHFRLGNNYTGTLDEFLETYVQDKVIFVYKFDANIPGNVHKNVLMFHGDDRVGLMVIAVAEKSPNFSDLILRGSNLESVKAFADLNTRQWRPVYFGGWI